MANRYIISLMAANRVGILAAVTSALDELGGDLQEVSQTVMQGFFTIILAAEFSDERKPQVIVDHIRGICRPFGVEVNLKVPADERLQEEYPAGTEKYFVTVTGTDKPGVLREISSRLARDGIDIIDLYAQRREGEQTFVIIMELAVPPSAEASTLQRELDELGKSLGLTATLQHENIFAATHDPRPVRITPHSRLPKTKPRTA